MGFVIPPEDQNTFFTGAKSAIKGLGSMFGNVFKAIPTSQAANYGNSARSRDPFYQVTAKDTSLDQIAKNTGVDLPTLVGANKGMKSLPPVGSYIATQNSNMAPLPQNTMMANGLDNGAASLGTTNKSTYKDARGIITAPITNAREQVNTAFNNFNEQYRLTGQVDTSLLPKDINLATIKALDAKGFFPTQDSLGNPLSPADALSQYGYVWDPKAGKFQQSGKAGKTQQQQPPLGTREGQVMDNKFVLERKGGKLVWRNTKRRAVKQAAPILAPIIVPEEAANAGGTQETTLGLNIGSG